ncbi:dihydroxyacetone kinase [Kitasatospora sp. MMS16-BH015]|uniref:DAK2 domain-containing protein n=1 Tax=Kitasatospora sp. MMS16-BH015 TaxID=2018025 RepID=UPI000CA16D04|nr:DAK2 domain-containing protein [Kitasatospora sp. MMS16-BH015]AUG79836.1 dihydroxyacetone kinase [Kitasatospora sp. MMS16-BH015]
MLDTIDASTVRTWCRLALAALGQAREEIDALNVYPVPDGDTGTNLYLTLESAAVAVEEQYAGEGEPGLAAVVGAMARGALIGARGNSGVILAQLLRGMAEELSLGGEPERLRAALLRAADSAYQAVAEPVEGTLLTVAAAAAQAAAVGDGLADTADTAYRAARRALQQTPDQLDVLAEAGVVDAGGRGLVAILGALADAVSGQTPMGPLALRQELGLSLVDLPGCEGHERPPGLGHPAFEVIYLLDAPDEALPALRGRLAGLGDSLVIGGGDGLWNVHVHVDDAGAAVEAGVEAGRPYQIRITHFAEAAARAGERAGAEPQGRAVLSVVSGSGLAELCEQAGAAVLLADPDRPPASAELAEALRRCAAREVVLLLNDPELRAAAGAAADQLREEGVRIAVLPTRSPVQGLAALAVHENSRRFDEDVVAMTSAAGATRYAELAVAEGESWTMAGVCQAGDVLGLIDGDVAVIGADLLETGSTVLARMLAAGGELVTLVLGAGAPATLADQLVAHARRQRPEVDTVVFAGGQEAAPLLIGVE